MTAPVDRHARRKALDGALRGLFGRLQARSLPDRLMSIVDQLDVGEAPPSRKVARG